MFLKREADEQRQRGGSHERSRDAWKGLGRTFEKYIIVFIFVKVICYMVRFSTQHCCAKNRYRVTWQPNLLQQRCRNLKSVQSCATRCDNNCCIKNHLQTPCYTYRFFCATKIVVLQFPDWSPVSRLVPQFPDSFPSFPIGSPVSRFPGWFPSFPIDIFFNVTMIAVFSFFIVQTQGLPALWGDVHFHKSFISWLSLWRSSVKAHFLLSISANRSL